MKFYKLKSLIYFFLYKLNRWLGGKTKWDIQDWQCISADWEYCIFLNDSRQLEMDIGVSLLNVYKHNFLLDWMYTSKVGDTLDMGTIYRKRQ